MYGQTEATARITCLPGALAMSRAGSAGKAVPGTLADGDRQGDTLRTGDLGYLADGLLYLAGRLDRQVKILGRAAVPGRPTAARCGGSPGRPGHPTEHRGGGHREQVGADEQAAVAASADQNQPAQAIHSAAATTPVPQARLSPAGAADR